MWDLYVGIVCHINKGYDEGSKLIGETTSFLLGTMPRLHARMVPLSNALFLPFKTLLFLQIPLQSPNTPTNKPSLYASIPFYHLFSSRTCQRQMLAPPDSSLSSSTMCKSLITQIRQIGPSPFKAT